MLAAADQTIAGTVKSLPRSPVNRPPLPVRFSAGKKAARATPICALSEAMVRSAAATSRAPLEQVGRQTGRNGRGLEVQGTIGQRKFGGALPSRTASACSNCARCTPKPM